MDDFRISRASPELADVGLGDPLTRKVSLAKSHVMPRNLADFEQIFRLISSREDGWLSVKIGNLSNDWIRKWAVFDGGVLYLSDSTDTPRDQGFVVAMDRVISIRTDDISGRRTSIVLTTAECKLCLKTESIDEMNKWIFCFQKSVALVLSKLLTAKAAATESTNQTAELKRSRGQGRSGITSPSALPHNVSSYSSTTLSPTSGVAATDDPKVWLCELGHGHGRHSMMLQQRNNFKEDLSTDREDNGGSLSSSNSHESKKDKSKTSATAALLDLGHMSSHGSSIDLTQLYARESGNVLKVSRDCRETANSLKTSRDDRKDNRVGTSATGLSQSLFDSHSFMSYPRPPQSQQNLQPHPTAIPIVKDQANDSSASSSRREAGGVGLGYDQKLATSYNDRLDARSLLDDEHVELRLRLMSKEISSDGEDTGTDSGIEDEDFPKDGVLDHLSSNYDSLMMFELEDGLGHSSSGRSGKSLHGGANPNSSHNISPNVSPRPKSEAIPSFVAVALDVLATEHVESPAAGGGISRPVSARYGHLSRTMMRGDKQPTWECGYCTIQGPRSNNEDRLVAVPDLLVDASTNATPFSPTKSQMSPPLQGYFAVYDGHCGDAASTYMQQQFHVEVCNHPQFWSDLRQAVNETVIRIDNDFLALCEQTNVNCGTTALGAFVRGNTLLVYNVGDCHGVLCSSGSALPLSLGHKPGRGDEKDRIYQAGGWITEEKELYMGRLHLMDINDPIVRSLAEKVNFVTIYRVCGDLAVTRSIGDPDYKNIIPGKLVSHWFPWPIDHSKVFNRDLVIPDPEFVIHTLTSEDEFMVLASDGLWDVICGDDVVQIVKESLSIGKSTSQAAEELCELALRLGSSDNVSIVIVLFSFV